MRKIAFIGNVDVAKHEPPIRNSARALETAQLLGEALGRAKYQIVVYAADSIEKRAVEGFLKGRRSPRQSIIFVFPQADPGPTVFEQFQVTPAAFVPQPYAGDRWGFDVFNSISAMDGVVIVGGGDFSFVRGVIAVIKRIPLVACSRYGGRAALVWRALREGHGLATPEEVNQMDLDGSREMARQCVASLAAQLKRRDSIAIPGQKQAVFVALTFLVALAGMLAFWFYSQKSHDTFQALLLFFLPLVAGVLGSSIGSLARRVPFFLATCATGATAGMVCSFSYVIGLGIGSGNQLPDSLNFYLILMMFGLVGGLTADRVLKQLETWRALKPQRTLEESLGDADADQGINDSSADRD
jgi:hypothetical protein